MVQKNETMKEWSKTPSGQLSILKSNLKRRFGITIEMYNQMIKNQNGVCAICGDKESYSNRKDNKIVRFSVDHCHKSQNNGIIRIRGLLCQRCNIVLGRVNDSIPLLKKMVKYLDKYAEEPSSRNLIPQPKCKTK